MLLRSFDCPSRNDIICDKVHIRKFKLVSLYGSVMEVHHPVFYVSLGHMQNNMRSSVTLKLKLKLTLTLTLTLTDTGGAVLTLMLGYRPGGELP